MSSCISGGGGRTLGFDLEIVISSSTSSRNSHHSSSPSSTISESSNSPIAISTRKPRTPRKRPNQTYNEAATLLSTAYPKIFPTKHLTKQYKFTNSHDSIFGESPSELLFHHQPPIRENPSFRIEPKFFNSYEKQCENDSQVNSMECCNEVQDDFDAESILDEEIEEGIDSIMGNLSVNNNSNINESNYNFNSRPIGMGFGGKLGFGFGFIPRGVRAFRQVDDGDWWRFPTVDVLEISPKLNRNCVTDKKKNKVERPVELIRSAGQSEELILIPKLESRSLILKLNHEKVMSSWSDRGSPFSEEMPELSSGNDGYERLAQIDLFSESGGIREASVLRYKEKRRTRLFSKKIRYQVRKVNADRRPRMKGRFVRRPNSMGSSQR